jgi:hypothetical protein
MNNLWIKFCPKCNDTMSYSTKKGLQDSLRAKRICKICCKVGNNNAEGSNRKRPHEWLYTKLCNNAKRKNQTVTLTYEEFLEFTKIDKCHYCNNENIIWPRPHLNSHMRGEATGYNLDRKDNTIGYIKENCVVCCRRCNDSKSNNWSYADWMSMTVFLREKNYDKK